jgi:hypothetical protein
MSLRRIVVVEESETALIVRKIMEITSLSAAVCAVAVPANWENSRFQVANF